ncbi:MAG TPA: hypothetical protein VME18_11350 [Acidobacteriaceae bacterium]|nr:hypothetical protein [Acidobacteriaceae bacterium]
MEISLFSADLLESIRSRRQMPVGQRQPVVPRMLPGGYRLDRKSGHMMILAWALDKQPAKEDLARSVVSAGHRAASGDLFATRRRLRASETIRKLSIGKRRGHHYHHRHFRVSQRNGLVSRGAGIFPVPAAIPAIPLKGRAIRAREFTPGNRVINTINYFVNRDAKRAAVRRSINFAIRCLPMRNFRKAGDTSVWNKELAFSSSDPRRTGQEIGYAESQCAGALCLEAVRSADLAHRRICFSANSANHLLTVRLSDRQDA